MKFFGHIEKQLQNIGITVEDRIQRFQSYSCVLFRGQFEEIAGPIPERLADETDAIFKPRIQEWFETILNAASQQEGMMFADAPQRIMRDELTSDPFFSGAAGSRGSSNQDVFYNDRFPPTSTRNVNRQRTFDNVPVAFLLYTVTFCLANDFTIRSEINRFINEGTPVPTFMYEKLKSCRRTLCGPFFIDPIVSNFIPDPILDLLGLRNTIWDYKYLRSSIGLQALFSFFARIHTFSGNYIEMKTDCKPVILDAGHQTTETALSFESFFSSQEQQKLNQNTRIERRVYAQISGVPLIGDQASVPIPSFTPQAKDAIFARILPQHSYGEKPNLIQVVDSYLLSRVLLDRDFNRIVIGFFSSTGEINSSTFNTVLYSIMRVSGQIHNDGDLTRVTAQNDDVKFETEGTQRAGSARKGKANNGKKKANTWQKPDRSSFTKSALRFFNVVKSLLENNFINSTQFTRLVLGIIGNRRHTPAKLAKSH